MPHLVPKHSYFNFAFPCHYRRKAPEIDGDLRDWQKQFTVPDLMALEDYESYAKVFMAWNEAGLYFGVRVQGKANPITVNVNDPPSADCLEICLDMRDARAMHHAGRNCHLFQFLPSGGGRNGKEAFGRPVDIARAPERGKLCDPSLLRVAVRPNTQGYCMEIAIPADALNGFDPEQHPRLGFTYLLNDTHLGTQWWSVSDHFRFRTNPSMWGTAVLSKP